jgi:DNA-binding FadR family transcriptional regulator
LEAVDQAHCDRAAVEVLRKTDALFHLAVMDAAKNRFLKLEVLRLHRIRGAAGCAIRLLPESGRETAHRLELQRHEEIWRKITSGKQSEARDAMQHHLQEIYAPGFGADVDPGGEPSAEEFAALAAFYSS